MEKQAFSYRQLLKEFKFNMNKLKILIPNLFKLQAATSISLPPLEPPNSGYSKDAGDNITVLTNLEKFLSNLISILIIIAAIFFIIYFFIAAFKWTTSGDDMSGTKKARDQMINATLGLILMGAAYGIVGIIGTAIGIDILNPADLIKTVIP